MPLYELRKGGRAIERVRTRPRGFEDTRLGLMAQERTGKDGWHVVDERDQAPAEPSGDTTGG